MTSINVSVLSPSKEVALLLYPKTVRALLNCRSDRFFVVYFDTQKGYRVVLGLIPQTRVTEMDRTEHINAVDAGDIFHVGYGATLLENAMTEGMVHPAVLVTLLA